jgi:hypothetical protein
MVVKGDIVEVNFEKATNVSLRNTKYNLKALKKAEVVEESGYFPNSAFIQIRIIEGWAQRGDHVSGEGDLMNVFGKHFYSPKGSNILTYKIWF